MVVNTLEPVRLGGQHNPLEKIPIVGFEIAFQVGASTMTIETAHTHYSPFQICRYDDLADANTMMTSIGGTMAEN